jgi:hypothetical protein
MIDEELMVDALDARVRRRENRRDFFKSIGSAAALVGGAAAISGIGSPAGAQAAPTDADVLNFALNLEYLEAQFYSFAVFGEGLPSGILGGTGTRGDVRGGRRVNFQDRAVAQLAREIAIDERAHVEFLRTALGAATVAQPAIDVSADANGAFSAAARAAGLVGAGQAFDPYANDENFLLGAFIFEDVGVTAYKGASPLITNKTFLEAAAGILAVEAYHAAIIRTTIFGKGFQQMPALIDASEKISNARDSLDDPTDKDQGVAPMGDASNIAPLDENGLAFSRSAADVLNIVYLNRNAVSQGGFFPNGVNGTIRASSAF